MIYVDTSAFMKLIWDEAESPALGRYLAEQPGAPLVSSIILAIEARRAVLRNEPTMLPRADVVLDDVTHVALNDAVVESAGRLPDPVLRSLDAIHLATALLIRHRVDVMITYDKRLAAAAHKRGIPTVAPS